MTRKEYEIDIKATRERIWGVLWNDKKYPKWTAPFAEGSHAETDWNQGSKVLFLGPDNCGMVSTIKKVLKYKYMRIEHQGIIKNGDENYVSSEAKAWKGAQENYTLNENKDKVKLLIETDIDENYIDTFDKAWPKALKIVKELSEK